MKKLISLTVCAMMALSTMASAATFSKDEDGWALASAAVKKADAEAYELAASIETKELTAEEAKAAGLSLGKGGSALTDDNSDFYQISLTASNVGDLVMAYIDDGNYDPTTMTQVRLYNVNITLPGVVAKKIAVDGSYEDIAWTSSDANAADLAMYWNAGSVDAMIPVKSEEGLVIEDAAMPTVKYVIAINPLAADLVVTPTMKVTYSITNADEDTTANATKATFNGDVVFDYAEEEVAELSIEATEVTNASATNKGYAWKIAGTTGEADLAGFSADFTADGVTKTKNATGLPEIKGGADYEFYVALRLSSVDAIDSASFTVTDAADATATDTWNK